MTDPSQAGGCYCGAVRYELAGALGAYANCHCRNCRRAHGAAFSTVALIPTEALRITAGEASVREYGTGTGSRFFCGECGGRLFNRPAAKPGLTTLSVASLDAEPTSPPAMHLNVESKAPWYEIRDDLPQFDGLPPDIA